MKYNPFFIVLFSAFTFFSGVANASAEFDRAEFFMKSGDYFQAAQRFYDIINNNKYKSEHTKALYLLSKTLSKVGMNQSAIYFLTSIARYNASSKYIDPALEALYELGFQVGDETALNYALSKIDIRRFPKNKKDLLYYRLGEVYLEKGEYKKAIAAYAKVPSYSKLFAKSRYNRGLAYSLIGNGRAAVKSYTDAVNARRTFGATDTQRVGALMGRARAFYQMELWNESVSAYRKIPRDSLMWHEALFESTWPLLRSGRFRSAMSNFQSLHSKFYDSRFLPEALVLRSIVYLYICKYEEVDKVLRTYDETYGRMRLSIASYIKEGRPKKDALYQMNKMLSDNASGSAIQKRYAGIPGIALNHISRKAEFKKNYAHLKNLYDEKSLNNKQNRYWKQSALGQQITKNLNKDISGVEDVVANYLFTSLKELNEELLEFSDQKEFIKFEVTSAKTEAARQKMRGTDNPAPAITAKNSRNFYIENGYEYWPFQGEYWLDEIGNYHYVGAGQCSK